MVCIKKGYHLLTGAVIQSKKPHKQGHKLMYNGETEKFLGLSPQEHFATAVPALRCKSSPLVPRGCGLSAPIRQPFGDRITMWLCPQGRLDDNEYNALGQSEDRLLFKIQRAA